MKETVLVVDDMPIIRDPIAATLTAAGYQALRAGNGKQALEMVRSQQVDLVLLDVNMPVMDGLAFLRTLRGDSSTAKLPVIMLSGAEDREDVIQAAKLGIQGYVLKSHFSLKDLLARVTLHFGSLKSAAGPNDAKRPDTVASVGIAEKSSSTANALGKNPERGHTPSGASAKPSEIPTLMNREQCIERARHSLQGRTLSGIVSEVVALTTSTKGDSSDLTAMISRDALVASRVLQVANSPAYATNKGGVSTIAEAVRNIGNAAVRNIAAAVGVFNVMPESESDGFNLFRSWQHSFAVATLCDRLATKQDSGVAYLVGLCHDLGEILFHSQFAKESQQILELQQSTGKPREELEKIMLGATRGEVLQTIVQCLELPNAISAPILEYQAKGPRSAGGSQLTRLLRTADLYANGMLLGSSTQSPVRPIACAEAKAATGHNNPPPFDRVAMRGEVLGLTAMMSRFPEKQKAEATASPFARRPIRIWLARDPSLSSFDPMEAALDLLADVTPRGALPNVAEAAEYAVIVISARSTSSPGFSLADVKKVATRPDGAPIPILWLAGRIDSEVSSVSPVMWPVPIARIAEFVAGVKGA